MKNFFSVCFLELTNHCNMNCLFCPNSLMTRPRGYMDIGLAKKVIDQLSKDGYEGTLITSLMGEPLLHPNFLEVTNYAIESKIKTVVITNLLALDKKVSLEELISLEIENLIISYQTPNRELFKQRKIAVDFEWYTTKIFEFIKEYKDRPKHIKKLSIHILHTFFNTINIEVVNDFKLIEILIGEFFDVLHDDQQTSERFKLRALKKFQSFCKGNFYLDDYEIPLSENIFLVMKRANAWANNLIPEGLNVIPEKKGRCGFFYQALGVFWDGRCTVCCQDFDGNIIIGDANKSSLGDIWNGEVVKQLRIAEKQGEMSHGFCQICKGSVFQDGRKYSLIKRMPVGVEFYQLLNRLKNRLINN